MTYLSTLIVGIALAASTAAQDPKAAKGTAALQGTWVIASINGQAAPEGAPPMTLTFAGDKYTQEVGGQVDERGTFKVNASAKPMTIDLSIVEGADAGKTQLGIFEVSGDTLRAHLDTPGTQQRPTDLTARAGSILFVAKRSPKK